MIDIKGIRKDFPILQKNYIFLDNAASTQKPKQVIDSITEFYTQSYANIHRGIYDLSEQATKFYEDSRKTIAKFISEKIPQEQIIFTKNATESLNLLADTLTRMLLKTKKQINILLSITEHHSNIIPWYIAKEKYKNINIEFIDINDSYKIDKQDFLKKIKNKDIVSLTGLSNVTGYKTDKELFKIAKQNNAITIIDSAQLTPHSKTNIENIDFLVFSGHKILGPTGIGILYGNKQLLEKMPTFLGGGEMIKEVTTKEYTANELPYKYEAGTMPFVQAYGLKKAIEYIEKLTIQEIENYEQKLTEYACKRLKEIKNIKIIGEFDSEKTSIISFTHKRFHPHDIAAFLNLKNISTRAGHHCAMPLHTRLGINGTTRISLSFYNTIEEIDKTIETLKQIDQK